jgi:hypothetical protein
MNLRVELPDPDESRTSCSARKSRLPHMKGATTPTNYKHPHEWLVFSIFIVKERPRGCVPVGEERYYTQAPLTGKRVRQNN